MSGTLYLIPTPLASIDPTLCLPASVISIAARLGHFVVEDAKTARAFLKQLPLQAALQSLQMSVLDEHTPPERIAELAAPLLAGNDIGLLSEAGCPAVADPGAGLVAWAQRHGIRAQPLVGPSSILLALMGSGLEGQRFRFNGYLPAAEADRISAIHRLEASSARENQTEIAIETPYRNNALLRSLLEALQPQTHLCVARALTDHDELIQTRSIAEWRQLAAPDLDRRPTVFLWQARTVVVASQRSRERRRRS